MKKIKHIIYILFVAALFAACESNLNLKSGDMKHIPYTKNYAIGTDSTIVIINRENGKTLNVIKRTSESE